MANRLVSNFILIDSGPGNNPWYTNGTVPAKLPGEWMVNAIRFVVTDTSAASALVLSSADTTNKLVVMDMANTLIHFAQPQSFPQAFKVPTLTNGEAILYLA